MATQNTSTGHIFISYAREDQTYARKLATDLQAHGFYVWMDDRIYTGDDWWTVIVQAIRVSAAFVVVMTPDSEKSEWVSKEILLALEEGKPAFPLLLRGRRFPIYVDKQYADVTSGQMPSASFYERLAEVALEGMEPLSTKAPTPLVKRVWTYASSHLVAFPVIIVCVALLLMGSLGYPAAIVWLSSTLTPPSRLTAVPALSPTSLAPTETPTVTSVSPTDTPTPVTPTKPPTETSVPPTDTPRPVSLAIPLTPTSVPPTDTSTPPIPTRTPTPAVLPPGKIAFTSDREGEWRIFVADLSDNKITRVTNGANRDSLPIDDWDPSWSPNGESIVFESGREGDFDIFTFSLVTHELLRLTTDSARNLVPAWSPNGDYIAFQSIRSGNFDIYLMRSDGSDVRKLTNHDGPDLWPSWSPDGQQIVFESNRQKNEKAGLYIMSASGTGVKPLLVDDWNNGQPTWSKNEQIAFYSDRDGNKEIYTINADGSNLKRITFNEAEDWFPAWSPDGKWITFTSSRDGNLEIYISDLGYCPSTSVMNDLFLA